jgi:hypothetical protein
MGWSEQRSIRMTGRMMTIAEAAFFPIDFPVRAARQTPGNFTTVPILFSPAPLARSAVRRIGRLERNRAPQG